MFSLGTWIFAHVADDEIVPWRERRVPVYRSFGRLEREAQTRVHGAAGAEPDNERSGSGDNALEGDSAVWDSLDAELDARCSRQST